MPGEVVFSGPAITIISGLVIALAGVIGRLFVVNERTHQAVIAANERGHAEVIAAKDAHINDARTVINDATLTLKGLMGAIAKLDEHLEATQQQAKELSTWNSHEHGRLIEAMKDNEHTLEAHRVQYVDALRDVTATLKEAINNMERRRPA